MTLMTSQPPQAWVSGRVQVVSTKRAPPVVKVRSPEGARALQRLRAVCLSLPGAVEKPSHGEPTWFTGEKGKVFAMFDDHHHGAPHVAVWLPAPPGVQGGLVGSAPDRYFVPPYVGTRGWVGVVLDRASDWALVTTLVNEAFTFIGPPPMPRRKAAAARRSR